MDSANERSRRLPGYYASAIDKTTDGIYIETKNGQGDCFLVASQDYTVALPIFLSLGFA